MKPGLGACRKRPSEGVEVKDSRALVPRPVADVQHNPLTVFVPSGLNLEVLFHRRVIFLDYQGRGLVEERLLIVDNASFARISRGGVPAVVLVTAVIPVEHAPILLVTFVEIVLVVVQVVPNLVDVTVGEKTLETAVEQHLAVHRLNLNPISQLDEVTVQDRA